MTIGKTYWSAEFDHRPYYILATTTAQSVVWPAAQQQKRLFHSPLNSLHLSCPRWIEWGRIGSWKSSSSSSSTLLDLVNTNQCLATYNLCWFTVESPQEGQPERKRSRQTDILYYIGQKKSSGDGALVYVHYMSHERRNWGEYKNGHYGIKTLVDDDDDYGVGEEVFMYQIPPPPSPLTEWV